MVTGRSGGYSSEVPHRLRWCCWVWPGAEGLTAVPTGRVLNLASDESSCGLSTVLTSVSCTFNGTAFWKDEIYGWAIKEKLARKIYNFPLKPVIHVINIDVI